MPKAACLISVGDTRVICAASYEERVPPWLRGRGTGWVTAEYSMLPRATVERTQREASRGKIGGRTHEIQRLIGRALRATVDMAKLGERMITIDCDVIGADGGTRTASITGAWVALALALRKYFDPADAKTWPLTGQIAAVSVGIVGGTPVLDLPYVEDSTRRGRHERRDDRRRRLRRNPGHRRRGAVRSRAARYAAGAGRRAASVGSSKRNCGALTARV